MSAQTGGEDQEAVAPPQPPAFNPDPHIIVPSVREDAPFRPTNDQSPRTTHDE